MCYLFRRPPIFGEGMSEVLKPATMRIFSLRTGTVLLLVAATALSACGGRKLTDFGRKKETITFDGFQYKSKAAKYNKTDRDHFEVTVSRATQSLDGARQAGKYEATKYCIKQYGTSSVDWVIGPETETIVPVDDKIRMEGYCRP